MANKIVQLKDKDGNNAYPMAYVSGGVKMDLLWTNPSPTSSFSAQTISMDLSDYKTVLITNRYTTTESDYKFSNVIQVGDSVAIYSFGGSGSQTSGTLWVSYRNTSVSTTGVTFETGRYISGSTNSTSDNGAIPYQIYGIKMSYIIPTEVNGLQYTEV